VFGWGGVWGFGGLLDDDGILLEGRGKWWCVCILDWDWD
jgi:hypothetical protein